MISYGKTFSVNEAENSLRALCPLFTLFSPSEYFLKSFAIVTAYTVFFLSVVLKLSFSTVGVLQLIQLLNSDLNFVFKFLGIDTVAIWKVRAVNSGISLIGVLVLLSFKSLPIFYYRLVRIEEPGDTWIISLMSNTLFFFSINLIVLVHLQKTYNSWKIRTKVLIVSSSNFESIMARK